jgi:DNA topoisomerase-1
MVANARAAGLHYVSDAKPGIRRRRTGRGFTYIAPSGTIIRDQQELRRFKALAIPPAWTDVWISPSSLGHIQATGRDAKGRKQYRYHPQWQETRGAEKYERVIAFAEALPGIRRRVQDDLALAGLPREKVVATVVYLLDETLIRIGNREYARANASFGLTTLQNKHADIAGCTLHFQFRGKSGKRQTVEVSDRRVANIVRRCLELPGQSLFEYAGESGEVHTVDSDDVNAYLRAICGEEFTAKDFRTWGGTVVAAQTLRDLGETETQTEAKTNVTRAIQEAAAHLGNTPAVCRKSYVHPGVLDAYLAHALTEGMQEAHGHFTAQQKSG